MILKKLYFCTLHIHCIIVEKNIIINQKIINQNLFIMKKMYKMSLLLMLFFFVASIVGVMAQPSKGGTPPSFKTSLADENQPFLVSPPDVQALLAEDEANSNFMPRAAVVLPVDLNPTNSGEWISL
jgi:hypothetical protein